MEPAWKQQTVFPIIARIIRQACQDHAKKTKNYDGYVSAHSIAARLLQDTEARPLIEDAQQHMSEEPSLEWLASNMVAWFSQRITVGQSEWESKFRRVSVDGEWAYSPAES